jgi:hypothetical protein
MRLFWRLSVLASMACSIPVGIVAVDELLAYSPYENPGPLSTGLWLGAIAVAMFAVPVLAVILRMAVADIRREMAWKRTLTPGQRLAVNLAEAAAMGAAHVAWRDHNRAVGAELTAKVMGDGNEQH